MPSPRSDWLCTRCAEGKGEEAATFDAPISTRVFCPACGKRKWVVRIYAAQISTEGHQIAKRVDRPVEAAWTEAYTAKEQMRIASARYPKIQVVPTNAAAATVQRVMAENGAPQVMQGPPPVTFKQGTSRPIARATNTFGQGGPVPKPGAPGEGSMIDKRYPRPG